MAIVEIEAGRAKIKVGTLEMDLDATGYGKIKLDGKNVAVRSMKIDVQAGNMPRVTLDIVPIEIPPASKPLPAAKGVPPGWTVTTFFKTPSRADLEKMATQIEDSGLPHFDQPMLGPSPLSGLAKIFDVAEAAEAVGHSTLDATNFSSEGKKVVAKVLGGCPHPVDGLERITGFSEAASVYHAYLCLACNRTVFRPVIAQVGYAVGEACKALPVPEGERPVLTITNVQPGEVKVAPEAPKAPRGGWF